MGRGHHHAARAREYHPLVGYSAKHAGIRQLGRVSEPSESY